MRNNDNKKRSRGRPTHKDTVTIQKDIMQFFNEGVSAQYCIDKTGYAKNTVYAYYREWTEELIEKTDFITQQQTTKVRLVASLDDQIHSLHVQKKALEAKRTDKFNAALENTLSNTIYKLSRIHIDKANILLLPTLDITLRKLIKDKWNVDIEEVSEQQTLEDHSRESS